MIQDLSVGSKGYIAEVVSKYELMEYYLRYCLGSPGIFVPVSIKLNSEDHKSIMNILFGTNTELTDLVYICVGLSLHNIKFI